MFTRWLKQCIKKHPNLSFGVAAACLAVINALEAGPDTFWDTLNYHFYTPFAILNGRLMLDIAPAGVHSYFNPTADFYYYFCWQLLAGWPKILAITQSVWYAITLFFVFKILRLCLKQKHTLAPFILTGLFFFFAPAVFIWSAYNTADMSSSATLISSLYFTLSSLSLPKTPQKTIRILLAGVLFGLTFALKYTTTPFLIAYIIVFCCCFSSFKEWLKYGLLFTAGALGTFWVAGGWWWNQMYQIFGNPLFPFYNNIFHSPYFDNAALIDYRFFSGKTWQEFLLLPLTFLYAQPMNISEGSIRGLSLLAYWTGTVYLLINKRNPRRQHLLRHSITNKLCIFFISGYILWLAQFALLRYAMPLEAVGGILFTCAIWTCFHGKYRFFIMGILCGAVCCYGSGYSHQTLFPNRLDSISFSDSGTREEIAAAVHPGAPDIQPNSVVILEGWKLSFLIPQLNPQAHYVGGLQANFYDYPQLSDRLDILNAQQFSPIFYRHRFAEKIYQTIRQAQHIYVLMDADAPFVFFREPLYHYGVKIRPNSCKGIDRPKHTYAFLCEADKL